MSEFKNWIHTQLELTNSFDDLFTELDPNEKPDFEKEVK